jgi:pantothenate kinase
LKAAADVWHDDSMHNREIKIPATLVVTEQQIDLSALSMGQRDFYSNLFFELVDKYEAEKKPRVVIGITGPTGAGKSVVAVLFKELARQANIAFALEAVTIDAYHFSNRFLLSHFSNGVPLKEVKGRFDTYDADALARDIRAFSSGKSVSFPTYSRKLHEPIKDSIVVEAENALLIVEGLWLLYDKAGWEAIGPLLNYSIFIEADPAKAKEPVLKRHMVGGRTFQEAARHYELVDTRNSDLVLATKHKANKVIPAYYSIS